MSHVRTYLQLCRFPALFTALADIVLGFLLTRTELQPLSKFLPLLGASAGLYLSGMVWNDIFDRDEDAAERPGRPIPSGRISLSAARRFAVVLMAGGLICAAVAGTNSLIVAGILTLAIFLYDGVLKRTWFGPLVMGSCRFLNVILGASSFEGSFTSLWTQPQLWVATCLGIYICGVTWFARTEATQSRRGLLIMAAVILNLGLVGLAAWVGGWTIPYGWTILSGGIRDPQMILMMLAVIAVSLNRRVLVALQYPEPAYVQAGVRVMLLSVIMLDATCIYFRLGDAGIVYAVGTALLVIPGLLIGKWMSMT